MTTFHEVVNLFNKEQLSLSALRGKLVTTAEAAKDQAIADKRASPIYDTVVDGDVARPMTEAQKQIVYVFHYALDAAAFALGYLQSRSYPGGTFAKSFWVGVEGDMYTGGRMPTQAPPEADIVIGNLVPYNRRVDVQTVGSHKLHYRTPEGLYEDAARAVNRQFGNTVKAKRVYDYQFPGKYRPVHRNYRFQSPALIISPR